MKKILVIDDTLPILDEVKDILEMEGFLALTAQNATDGLKLVYAKQPDLVITDLHMSGVDGFTLIKKIRSDHNLVDLPIVVLSAKVDQGTVSKAKALGVNEYLKKPCSAEKLVASIVHKYH
ncbi:MAG: response regulator [Bacteroidota bacterium]